MMPEDVRWLHVEASSNCNAWCPQCPRNVNGYGLVDGTIEQDLDIDVLEKTLQQLPNLYAIQFCGNHGDAVIAKNFIDMVDIAKKYVKKIQIHTNGSIRNKRWWGQLAHKLSGHEHDVWFGIDGLAGVHELYRQGTKWNKIIDNAKAFIANGGNATWQFVPFAHNEHQIKDCLKLSQQLKFKNFKIIKSNRGTTTGHNYKTGKAYITINPPTNLKQFVVASERSSISQENCMHLTQPSIYLDALGKYSYCCYYSSNFATNKIRFDSLDDLFYNTVDIKNNFCIKTCGS